MRRVMYQPRLLGKIGVPDQEILAEGDVGPEDHEAEEQLAQVVQVLDGDRRPEPARAAQSQSTAGSGRRASRPATRPRSRRRRSSTTSADRATSASRTPPSSSSSPARPGPRRLIARIRPISGRVARPILAGRHSRQQPGQQRPERQVDGRPDVEKSRVEPDRLARQRGVGGDAATGRPRDRAGSGSARSGRNRSASQGSGRVRFSSSRRTTTDQTAPVRCWSISQASARRSCWSRTTRRSGRRRATGAGPPTSASSETAPDRDRQRQQDDDDQCAPGSRQADTARSSPAVRDSSVQLPSLGLGDIASRLRSGSASGRGCRRRSPSGRGP